MPFQKVAAKKNESLRIIDMFNLFTLNSLVKETTLGIRRRNLSGDSHNSPSTSGVPGQLGEGGGGGYSQVPTSPGTKTTTPCSPANRVVVVKEEMPLTPVSSSSSSMSS